MTAGSPPHPVRNFQDVLDHGYRVILVGGTVELDLLKTAKNDSAKHLVYKLYFEDDDNKIQDWFIAKENDNLEEMRRIVLPSWLERTKKNFDWAAKQIIDDRKTLWYGSKTFAVEEIAQGNVIELQMDDMVYVYAGFLIRKDSEYLSVINHYVQKAFETGTFNRIDLTYNPRTPIKIGMTEPGSLGMNNVMFLFMLLGAFMVISFLVAIVENVINMCEKKEVNK